MFPQPIKPSLIIISIPKRSAYKREAKTAFLQSLSIIDSENSGFASSRRTVCSAPEQTVIEKIKNFRQRNLSKDICVKKSGQKKLLCNYQNMI
jgi:hypothetical protein